jgi:endonuclease YncB( thermonuclease family)
MFYYFVALVVGVWFSALGPSISAAESLADHASVINGDTIEIGGERIRILDIDAPELDQTCVDRGKRDTWPCGQEAARALAEWLKHYSVDCETHGTDYIGRWFAHCEVATVRIATWMAANGWAVPNQDCQCAEVRAWAAFARSKEMGIWGSEFVMPWDWRKLRQQQ